MYLRRRPGGFECGFPEHFHVIFFGHAMTCKKAHGILAQFRATVLDGIFKLCSRSHFYLQIGAIICINVT